MISSVGALLLISDDAASLAAFYREAVKLALVDEEHQDVPLHYGCEITGLHFAIHPAADWPGKPTPTSQGPVIVFYTPDVHSVHERS